MSEQERFYLYDETENTKTRYISFMGENHRFDLAVIQTERYYGKSLVLDIQSGKFAIIGQDDLEEEGYIEHAFQMNEEQAKELTDFLLEIV